MNPNDVLVDIDINSLKSKGLAAPDAKPGIIKLHNSAFTVDHSPTSLSIDGWSTIPTQLASYQTLLHLGLAPARADQLWREWNEWPSTGPQREELSHEIDDDQKNDCGLTVTFVDFILGRVRPVRAPDADDRHPDMIWAQCLDACGVDDSLQAAIMDPTFASIRLSQSCVYWVIDTIKMRYAGLLQLQRVSRQRVTAAKPPGSAKTTGSHGDQSKRPAQTDSARSRQQRLSEAQQAEEPDITTTPWRRLTAAAAANRPGYTVLYKGLDQARLSGFWYNSNDNINSSNRGDNDDNANNSRWRVEKLLSFPPTNFSGRRAMFYFTPDPQVAAYYAAYAKRRSACESVVIVTLTIKTEDLDKLEHPEEEDNTTGKVFRLFYPSPHWKQMVWRSKTARALPKPLRQYRDALLLIGTTTKGAQRVFEEMTTWEDIGSQNILRVPDSHSRPAVQYVFSDEEGGDFLREKGEFAVFPFSTTSMETLVARID